MAHPPTPKNYIYSIIYIHIYIYNYIYIHVAFVPKISSLVYRWFLFGGWSNESLGVSWSHWSQAKRLHLRLSEAPKLICSTRGIFPGHDHPWSMDMPWICDDMWWYVMICDGMWWYVIICDDMWWYVMICDDMWWYVMICDDMWWYDVCQIWSHHVGYPNHLPK